MTRFFSNYVTPPCSFFFFFNDTATTEIYTLSLHDALPISSLAWSIAGTAGQPPDVTVTGPGDAEVSVTRTTPYVSNAQDRKSTRLNSSHANISYAVFCLKKKNGSKDRCRGTGKPTAPWKTL